MDHKLTRIVKHKVHSNRVNLYLDHDNVITTTVELVYRFSLKPGMELTEEMIAQLIEAEQQEAAKSCALNYLDRRICSSQQMRNYLSRKGFPDSVISLIVNWLVENQLLNDKQYASSFIHSRLQNRPRSKNRIRFELLQKGIESDVIDHAIDIANINEQETAVRLVTKRLRTYHPEMDSEWRQKTLRWLLTKGFSLSVARFAVQSALADRDQES